MKGNNGKYGTNKVISPGSYAIIVCPVCGKHFVYNPTSIYKGHKGNKLTNYCCYTCWRKAGADDKMVRTYVSTDVMKKPRGKAVSKKKMEVVV